MAKVGLVVVASKRGDQTASWAKIVSPTNMFYAYRCSSLSFIFKNGGFNGVSFQIVTLLVLFHAAACGPVQIHQPHWVSFLKMGLSMAFRFVFDFCFLFLICFLARRVPHLVSVLSCFRRATGPLAHQPSGPLGRRASGQVGLELFL